MEEEAVEEEEVRLRACVQTVRVCTQAENNKTVCLCSLYLRMKCVVGFVMLHNVSRHSLQCSCLSVFKVAIIAIFNSSLLQLS